MVSKFFKMLLARDIAPPESEHYVKPERLGPNLKMMRYDWSEIVDAFGQYDRGDKFSERSNIIRKTLYLSGGITITRIRNRDGLGKNYLDLTDDEVLAIEPLRAEWNSSRLRAEDSKRESDRKNAEREVERRKLADARKAEEMRAKVAAMTANKETP